MQQLPFCFSLSQQIVSLSSFTTRLKKPPLLNVSLPFIQIIKRIVGKLLSSFLYHYLFQSTMEQMSLLSCTLTFFVATFHFKAL